MQRWHLTSHVPWKASPCVLNPCEHEWRAAASPAAWVVCSQQSTLCACSAHAVLAQGGRDDETGAPVLPLCRNALSSCWEVLPLYRDVLGGASYVPGCPFLHGDLPSKIKPFSP